MAEPGGPKNLIPIQDIFHSLIMKLNKLPQAAGRLVKSTVYADSDLVPSIEGDKKKMQFVLVKVKAKVFFLHWSFDRVKWVQSDS